MSGKDQKKKNLSDVNITSLEKARDVKIGIVTSDWNEEVTLALKKGCVKTLLAAGITKDHIFDLQVPGAFELPYGAKMLINEHSPHAIICIGCVIKGETSHNDYINNAVAQGITQLSLFANVPIIYGVLTPNTMAQALERAGGAHGNKGVEAAATAIQMIQLKHKMKESKKRIGFG